MLDNKTMLALIHALAEKSQPHFFEVHTFTTKYDESHKIVEKYPSPGSIVHRTIYDHNMGRDEAQLIADLLNLGIGSEWAKIEPFIKGLIEQPAASQTPRPTRCDEMIALLKRSEDMLANASSTLFARNQLTEEQILFTVDIVNALRTEIVKFLFSIKQEG